jgi:peptide deformylase
MIRSLCHMGNPILRSQIQEVSKADLSSDEFQQLLVDLKDSMKHYGGVGLAAPQIGIALKVAVIELTGVNRYGENLILPTTYFINPVITVLDQHLQGYWEGCLSVPGLRGFVERPTKIQIRYLSPSGEELEMIAEGFLATVIQHEFDHLEGVLYLDKLKDTKLLSFQAEFENFILPSLKA